MNTSAAFVKETIFKGLLFLIPVALVVVIFSKVIELLSKLAHPLVQKLGIHSLWGLGASQLFAVAILLVVTLGAGLVAQTRTGEAINRTLERMILRKMPGYTLLKSMDTGTDGANGVGGHAGVSVALAGLNGAWALAFVMEEHANGLRTIFIPRSPTPAAGNLYFMTEDQIRRLSVPVGEAMKSVARLGVGSKAIFEGQGTAVPNQRP
jgi:uncharacterized membrane protein